MQFRKTIFLPVWDETVKAKVITYWKARGITFTTAQGDVLMGRRGSLWGNFTSFDMSKLITTLTISRKSVIEIECVLDINTVFQLVTEWNKAYWQLEMDTLESWLLNDDLKEEQWKVLQRGINKHALQWMASLGTRGEKLTPEVEDVIYGNDVKRVLLRGSSAVPTSQLLRAANETEQTPAQHLLRGSDKQDTDK